MSEYLDFLKAKSQLEGRFGFAAPFQHPMAYDFQSHLVDWAVDQGRAAIFADCGLGKTLMQLTWAENVVRHTNRPVLILAPLMVSMQTAHEAEKFGFEAKRSLDGVIKSKIVTTNYERLHHFNPDDFAGVVCDESSILKNFDGSRKGEITEFMRRVQFRLMCSATPSPNDYIELGTSSEALGNLGYMDMLGMFFKNDEDSLHPAFIGSKWRLKHHAEKDFWRWVCSWARAIRRPSDLGFEDGKFQLPALIETDHVISSPMDDGALFPGIAKGLPEERAEKRSTLFARCERAAELSSANDSSVAWCHLNDEASALVSAIDGAVQIKGGDHEDRKEEVLSAFLSGQITHLVTKPKIAAFGLNWQHANHMTFFADHSFEQYYQAVRRMWRFGQTRPVTVDIVTTEALLGVSKNLRRKAAATDEMFRILVDQMNDAMGVNRLREHHTNQEIPSWL